MPTWSSLIGAAAAPRWMPRPHASCECHHRPSTSMPEGTDSDGHEYHATVALGFLVVFIFILRERRWDQHFHAVNARLDALRRLVNSISENERPHPTKAVEQLATGSTQALQSLPSAERPSRVEREDGLTTATEDAGTPEANGENAQTAAAEGRSHAERECAQTTAIVVAAGAALKAMAVRREDSTGGEERSADVVQTWTAPLLASIAPAASGAIVLDLGSLTVRVGLATDALPRATFPSILGTPKVPGVVAGLGADDVFVGAQARAKRALLLLNYPLQRGLIVDWEGLGTLLRHTFDDCVR